MLDRTGHTLFAVLILGALALAPRAAQASNGPISATLYPAHMHITFVPDLTNQDMDCQWGFNCPADSGFPLEPLFHSVTEDALHRLGGWTQSARLSGRKGLMLFFLFFSHYDPKADPTGAPWVDLAFSDLGYVARSYGFSPLAHRPQLLPTGELGKVLAKERHTASFDSILLGCRTGSIDVEALAIYDHASASGRKVAMRDLVLQVRAALG